MEKLIKEDPFRIDEIENPSKELQIIAIKKNPFAIIGIKNPSLFIQIMAVKKSPDVIINIKKPYEQVQLIAINSNKSYFDLIDFPTKNVKKIIKEYIKNFRGNNYLLKSQFPDCTKKLEKIKYHLSKNEIEHLNRYQNEANDKPDKNILKNLPYKLFPKNCYIYRGINGKKLKEGLMQFDIIASFSTYINEAYKFSRGNSCCILKLKTDGIYGIYSYNMWEEHEVLVKGVSLEFVKSNIKYRDTDIIEAKISKKNISNFYRGEYIHK